MATNFFGGLVKGIAEMMPQGDVDVQIFNAQTELSTLVQREKELYAEVGQKAIEQYGAEAFGDTAVRLQLLQSDLEKARANIQELTAQKEEQERKEQEKQAQYLCPSCGYENGEGVKFCQECGARLTAPPSGICPSCGVEIVPGAKFCRECGAKL
ncbi:MAG: zinc ribbon domain-containing protein [Oscillospiraceae bacterium]|nr:zinc ribbon domain-containing protein [Oscillospiraceae bacterium]